MRVFVWVLSLLRSSARLSGQVGGGNYTELTNLETEEKHKIVYGATELLSADGFLDQLHTLGAPPASAAAAGAAPAK